MSSMADNNAGQFFQTGWMPVHKQIDNKGKEKARQIAGFVNVITDKATGAQCSIQAMYKAGEGNSEGKWIGRFGDAHVAEIEGGCQSASLAAVQSGMLGRAGVRLLEQCKSAWAREKLRFHAGKNSLYTGVFIGGNGALQMPDSDEVLLPADYEGEYRREWIVGKSEAEAYEAGRKNRAEREKAEAEAEAEAGKRKSFRGGADEADKSLFQQQESE